MSRLFLMFYIPVILLITFSACDESDVTGPSSEVNKNYFPSENNTFYRFNIFVTDSTGQQDILERRKRYLGEETIENVVYQKQVDTLITNGLVTENVSYFRKTESGVFYFADTTNFADVIPDSLRDSVKFDVEYRTLFFPLTDGQTFPVYKAVVELSNGFSFSFLSITAKVLTSDSLTLNLTSGTELVEAKKIEYELKVIADSSGNFDTDYAYGWIAEDIGFVKWEGNTSILNLFNLPFPIADSSEVRQEIKSYFLP